MTERWQDGPWEAKPRDWLTRSGMITHWEVVHLPTNTVIANFEFKDEPTARLIAASHDMQTALELAQPVLEVAATQERMRESHKMPMAQKTAYSSACAAAEAALARARPEEKS